MMIGTLAIVNLDFNDKGSSIIRYCCLDIFIGPCNSSASGNPDVIEHRFSQFDLFNYYYFIF